MVKKHLEIVMECGACSGTGLYVGMAERDGAAVVCHQCDGTGRYVFKQSYNEFEGRQKRKEIKRVYRTNPGICVNGTGAVPGGVSYKDWVDDPKSVNKPGTEMREHVCPAWWYQGADYKKKPNWKECIGMGTFSSCKSFPNKGECWKRWDKENKNA